MNQRSFISIVSALIGATGAGFSAGVAGLGVFAIAVIVVVVGVVGGSLAGFAVDLGDVLGAAVARADLLRVVDTVILRWGELSRRLSSKRNRLTGERRGLDRNVGDWLVSVLLCSALEQLPFDVRDRWSEEWMDHSEQRAGWRRVWWALCLRATATRTGREYRQARLPLGGG